MTISIKPTASGSTIEQDGSTILTVDGSGNISATNNFSATGHVLQVVNSSGSLALNTTSTSYVDTGLSATITPSSTSSKILVLISHVTQQDVSASSAAYAGFQLLRDSTSISEWVNYLGNAITTSAYNLFTGINYLDSPATTSAITYKTQVKRNGGSGTVYLNINSPHHSITLMEIAG